MGGTYRNPDLGAILGTLAMRLRAIESQQQAAVANLQGVPVMVSGLLVTQSGASGYGLMVLDPAQNLTQILPEYDDYESGPITVTTTGPAIPTDSPSVTFYTGLTGDAIITVSATITGSATPQAFLVVDGLTASTALLTLSGATATCSNRFRMSAIVGSTLSPNAQHNFTLAFASGSASVSATFTAVTLMAEPV